MNTIIDKIDLWVIAQELKTSNRGRSASNQSLLGIKKLRDLILELAVRGKLVSQEPNDEPASELLIKIEAEKRKLIKEGIIKKQESLPKVGEDEKPFNLPVGWEWVRIRSVGHDWGQKTPATDFTYIEVSAIDNTKGELKSPTILTASEAPSRARKIVKPGTVIYSTVRPYLKNICVIDQEYSPEPIASTAFAILHPYLKMPGRFFLFYLQSPVFVRYVESEQIGIAYPAINDKQFFGGLIPLPPLAEQHRIVAKVDELMALCDELENQQTNSNVAHETLVATLLGSLNETENSISFNESWHRIATHFDILFTTEHSIDQLKQTILQLAVMGKLTQQNPNDEPASELLKKIAKEKTRLIKEGKIKKQAPLPEISDDEKPFELPDGWEWERFGELLIEAYTGLDKGKSQQGSELKINYFKMNNILNDGGFDLTDLAKVDATSIEIEKYRLKNGDFLFNTRNSRELVGKTCVIRGLNNEPLLYNNNILRTKFSHVSPEFIDFWFRSSSGKLLLEKIKSNTTNVCAIYQGKLFEMLCIIPPIAVQNSIVSKVDELFAMCEELKERLVEAQTLQNQMTVAVVEQALSTQPKENVSYIINEQITMAAEP